MANEPRQFFQQFFKPGWWYANGTLRRFTKKDLAERCANTDAFIQANPAGGIPLFPKHAKAGSKEGGPRLSDRDSRDCTGWLTGVEMDADGACHLRVNVGDPKTADGIDKNTIRFTSPEMSAGDYIDSKDKNWGPLFRHIATTAAPRNRDQGPITSTQFSEDCIQFTEDDFMGATKVEAEAKAAQFAEDEAKRKAEVVEAIDEATDAEDAAETTAADNPNADELATNDTEADTDASEDAEVNAMIVRLIELTGIELPPLASKKEVLTAIINREVAKQQAAAEATGGLEIEEEPAVTQFSEEATAMIAALKERNAALTAEKTAATNVKNRASVSATIATAKIPKRMKARLNERANALQFSEAGEEEPMFTIGQVIAMWEEGIPKAIQFAEEGVTEVEHPDGEEFYEKERKEGEPESDEDVGKAVDEQLRRAGMGGEGSFTGSSPEWSKDFRKEPAAV